jgi:hypothetical protein
MNKLFVIIVLLLISIDTYSQDKVDPDTLNLNFQDTSVFNTNPNIFLRGWNYFTIGQKFDEALKMNVFYI